MDSLIYTAKWGLDSSGAFRQDPWFYTQEGKIIRRGFGEVSEKAKRVRLDGVVLPGLINAHTHLEFSYLKTGSKKNGVFDFIRSSAMQERPGQEYLLQKAKKQWEYARSRGTFFFCDISNDAKFSYHIGKWEGFQGLRFLEILGFCSPFDEKRLNTAKMALHEDEKLNPTPHSVYGSSPMIWRFCSEKESKWRSVHFLEDASERQMGESRGDAFDFLKGIGQICKHSSLENFSICDYLKSFNVTQRTLLVHLNAASKEEIEGLEKNTAIVICPRSSDYLGYERKNWRNLQKSHVPVLLGTDSCGTSPDISVLHELAYALSLNRCSSDFLWRAATYAAYETFGLKLPEIPHYFFPGAEPEIASLLECTPVLLPAIGYEAE